MPASLPSVVLKLETEEAMEVPANEVNIETCLKFFIF